MIKSKYFKIELFLLFFLLLFEIFSIFFAPHIKTDYVYDDSFQLQKVVDYKIVKYEVKKYVTFSYNVVYTLSIVFIMIAIFIVIYGQYNVIKKKSSSIYYIYIQDGLFKFFKKVIIVNLIYAFVLEFVIFSIILFLLSKYFIIDNNYQLLHYSQTISILILLFIIIANAILVYKNFKNVLSD